MYIILLEFVGEDLYIRAFLLQIIMNNSYDNLDLV